MTSDKNKEEIMIKELAPVSNRNAADYMPTYSVPKEKALIKAKRETGFLTLIIGLILWYFNSDRK